MKLPILATLALQTCLSTAHFGLTYPSWRIDSLAETNESISQWTYPCAGAVPMQNTSQPRTPWPIQGGSVVLELHHPWTYVFVNLGFGTEVTNFNVSLNPEAGKLVNETGNGTFCWNTLPVPSAEILGLEIMEGMEGSIQVVTVGDSGSALYNCADIVFSSNATVLPQDQCFNSTGVSAQTLSESASAADGTDDPEHNATTSGSVTSSSSSSDAVGLMVPGIFVLAVAGLMAL